MDWTTKEFNEVNQLIAYGVTFEAMRRAEDCSLEHCRKRELMRLITRPESTKDFALVKAHEAANKATEHITGGYWEARVTQVKAKAE